MFKMNSEKAVKKSEVKKPFVVVVEGNIASGKSTMLNYFGEIPEIQTIMEPVEKWRNCNGLNLLDLMYKDSKQWLFPFQSYTTLTMLQNHSEKCDRKIKLMERSFQTVKNVFMKASEKMGTIHSGMHKIFDEWFDYIEKNIQIHIDLIVYLRCTPEIAYERMEKRGRIEEGEISMEYLEILHELHEEWLIHNRTKTSTEIIVLDANQEDMCNEYENLKELILNKN